MTLPLFPTKLDMVGIGDHVVEKALDMGLERSAQQTNTPSDLFLQAFEQSSLRKEKDPANTDREYGVPSPARQLFNEAFKDFQTHMQSDSPEEALAKSNAKMSESITQADHYTERAQTVFYNQVADKHKQDSKPSTDVIEKLQLLSAALTSVMPGKREDLMRDLAKGVSDKLKDYDEVKAAYDRIPDEFASGSKSALLKSWLDYRAGIGDSIGQRQVYIGLHRRFGSEETADQHEEKVTAYKNRIGGRFVFD